jgi:phosphate transport system permease protein
MSAEPNPLMVVTPRSRRRKRIGHVMEGISTAAAVLAIVVLGIVIFSVARKGLPALSVDFFTKSPAPVFQTGGGIQNAIVGTFIMTAMATAIAVPMGVLVAIFNTEFAPPQMAELVRLALNILAGVPTIVIGIFIFGLLVVGSGQSAIAASIGLSIVMLPLIARATEEVLALVPSSLREAGMALGATRARTVITVILPTTVGGIVTATIVAVARVVDFRQLGDHQRAPSHGVDPADDLRRLRVTQRCRPAHRLGGSSGADDRRPCDRHHRARALAAHPPPDRAGEVSTHERLHKPTGIGQDADHD